MTQTNTPEMATDNNSVVVHHVVALNKGNIDSFKRFAEKPLWEKEDPDAAALIDSSQTDPHSRMDLVSTFKRNGGKGKVSLWALAAAHTPPAPEDMLMMEAELFVLRSQQVYIPKYILRGSNIHCVLTFNMPCCQGLSAVLAWGKGDNQNSRVVQSTDGVLVDVKSMFRPEIILRAEAGDDGAHSILREAFDEAMRHRAATSDAAPTINTAAETGLACPTPR